MISLARTMSLGGLRVLCVLVGVLLAVTSTHGLSCVIYQANTTWTPCPGMTQNKDIHLDQLSGKWYMHQRLIPAEGNDTSGASNPAQESLCVIMTLQKTDRGFLASGTSPGAKEPWRNNATLVVQEPVTYPGLWDETIITEKGERTISRSQLIHQGSKALVVAICPPTSAYACNELGTKPTILVWGRNATANSLNLTPINAKIRQAGISYVDKAVKIDTTPCSGHV